MATKNTSYKEIKDIRDDLDSLKNNVIELTRHLQKDGEAQTHEMKEKALSRLADLRKTSEKQIKDVEKQVKAKPAQSLAIAFATGLLASFLLKR